MRLLPSNPLPQIVLQRMNAALAPPPCLASDGEKMFLGQTEQRCGLYQALTSGYRHPLLKVSGGAGDPSPKRVPPSQNASSSMGTELTFPLLSTHRDVFHPRSLISSFSPFSPFFKGFCHRSPQQLPFLCQGLSCHLPPGLLPGPAAFLTPFSDKVKVSARL